MQQQGLPLRAVRRRRRGATAATADGKVELRATSSTELVRALGVGGVSRTSDGGGGRRAVRAAAARGGAAAGGQEESWAEPEFPQAEATVSKLGWHELCEHVAGFASTELGRGAAADLWLPSTRAASEVRASLCPLMRHVLIRNVAARG